jgi:hypothetical protein
LLTVGMVIAVAVVFLVVYNVYDSVLAAHQPPKEFKYTKVPVKVGDKWVLLGAQVIQWEIPPEVEAAYLDHLLAEIKAREEAARQKAEKDQAGATEQKDPSDESRAEPANDKKGARATRAKGKDAP